MTTTKPRKGDTVRVSRKFEVERVSSINGIYVVDSGESVYYSDKWTIKVVKKRQVKVGEEVTGAEARELPIGSVVLYEPGQGASIKITETEWTSARHDQRVPTWKDDTKFRVLHVGT